MQARAFILFWCIGNIYKTMWCPLSFMNMKCPIKEALLRNQTSLLMCPNTFCHHVVDGPTSYPWPLQNRNLFCFFHMYYVVPLYQCPDICGDVWLLCSNKANAVDANLEKRDRWASARWRNAQAGHHCCRHPEPRGGFQGVCHTFDEQRKIAEWQ